MGHQIARQLGWVLWLLDAAVIIAGLILFSRAAQTTGADMSNALGGTLAMVVAFFAFPTVGAIGLICGGVALSSLPSPSPPTPQQRRRDEANLLACQSPWPSTDVSITWTPLALIPACSVPSLWNSLDAVY